MEFTNCTTREPIVRLVYESWTCIYTVSLFNDIHFTNGTTRKPLSHKWSVTNDMHVTIDPPPVQPVNYCFTTCMGRTSRALCRRNTESRKISTKNSLFDCGHHIHTGTLLVPLFFSKIRVIIYFHQWQSSSTLLF